MIKGVREEIGKPIAMLLDTKGPEIRTGLLKNDGKVTLTEGNEYTLTTRQLQGDETVGHITYEGLPADVNPGDKILIDDGLIELEVIKVVDTTDIVCRIINGGELGQRKGVNVPNVKVKLPGITEKDKEDILFGIENGFDFIAASFVRDAKCIYEIKDMLSAHHSDISVIAKIENSEGIENIDEIIAAADGIMVARGDMGVEIPAEKVPYIQKMIIKKCNAAYKPVITATQMLDSMMRNPRPTRAEVTDVANAIYDGTDAVMLSGETAQGKYPVEALKMMAQIAESTEEHLNYHIDYDRLKLHSKRNISSAVSVAVVTTAHALHAKAIICPTISGFTARLISKFKPDAEIIGVSPSDSVLRKMQIYWGVRAIKSIEEYSTEIIMIHAADQAKAEGYIKSGDLVVLTGGVATSTDANARLGLTNQMRVINVY